MMDKTEFSDKSWFSEPGFYDMNMGRELVLADSTKEKGIEYFSHDVYIWTIDEDAAR